MTNASFFLITEYSVLLQWKEEPSRDLTKLIHRLEEWVMAQKSAGVLECVPAGNSIAIIFDPETFSHEEVELLIEKFPSKNDDFSSTEEVVWEIPILYYNEDSEDIRELMNRTGKSYSEIISLHENGEYWVNMIGFLPGFLYLSGLSHQLHLPRKPVPSPKVHQGAVGIAGTQSGIYPQESPGGWHILGRTPMPMFQVTNEKPTFASIGDRIRFRAINSNTFLNIEKQIAAHGLSWESSGVTRKINIHQS